ncbi:MAG TPA: hypothetical protein VGJ86_05910 [Acidimicrobiales bacterium]|jgi:hypothetical protein
MGDERAAWWLGADRLWRKGAPPAEWRQSHDGRWHPPPDPLDETALLPVTGHRQQPAGRQPGHARQGPPEGNDLRALWRKWAALGTIVLAGLIGTVALALATTATGAGPHEAAADRPGQPSVGGTPSQPAASPSTVPPVTSTSQPGPAPTTTSTPTTDPATTTPDDPFALCAAQGFRLGHRGHDLDWYQNHFDRDGDGILCN